MKRHNFSGNRATHGVSISHRSHGSTGQCQDPGKVFKGKKMAGRLGNVKKTMQNLQILQTNHDDGLIVVKGSVPGPKGVYVSVRDSVKNKVEDLPYPTSSGGEVTVEETPKTKETVKAEETNKNDIDKSSPTSDKKNVETNSTDESKKWN